ncbi:atp-dependent deoxyribonuclease, subunit b [Ligilactobacillus hayakitensis DSM 18933 = JCM 14209]|uniref:ATP-dependent helicase/deoxyribonuclease subunit B n=1 Tax=Ligilactobacillus hayakitensis DSM 18933 = JCM 14209 TaxID=1423755 RepID=A0A0R1WNY4_9LACO|nr:PD-(D/E)XK nuclease family protein [Ligilactobacillus hayakitensis]KRM19610.1 atp-dependent deoxyribonuclease, subunit b [Ligilactobacillus hayakitensis DSM 18933 = JCM 14209]
MSLGFVLGDATKNHRLTLMQQLEKWKQENPQGKFFYLVPNHIKFGTEITLLDYLRKQGEEKGLYAANNVQIFSFTRLAWYFMKDTAIYQTPRISAAGLNMLVYRLLKDHSDELTIFKGEETQPGFISQLVSQLIELQTACISQEDLKNLEDTLNQTKKSQEVSAKLHDLQIIYHDFIQKTQGKYLKNTDILPELAQYLQAEDLSNSYFLIESFSQFTSQEQQVLSVLLKRAKEVRVGLVLDHKVTAKEDLSDAQTLFSRSERLYYQLYQQARKNNIPVVIDQYASENRIQSPDLRDLAKYWQESTDLGKITPNTRSINDIKVIKADTRMTEVRTIAARIKQAVTLKGYHYSDFLLLTRHLDKYKNILEPVFEEFEIPLFLDLQKTMTNHPLVELLNALFAVKKRHYRYQDMMRLLKTELLIPKINGEYMIKPKFREYLDLTENLVLKFGYEGSSWIRKKDWVYYRMGMTDFGTRTDQEDQRTKEVNILRHFIKEILPPFFKRLDSAENGMQAAQYLMEFLLENGVAEQLTQWRNQALEIGDTINADKPEQVWNLFCVLMDEYVQTLGDTEFDEDDFINLLGTGFEGASYSQVPSYIDQVIVSESGMVQSNDRKITFMFGSTDMVMPDRIQKESLLNDNDRKEIIPQLNDEQYLMDTAENMMAQEPYLNYLAFMTPIEQLYLMYPTAGASEEGLRISPYLERIIKHFKLKVHEVNSSPNLLEQKLVDYVANKRTTLSNLIKVARVAKDEGEILPPYWGYIYQRLREDGNYRDLTALLMSGISYSNQPEQLKVDYVEQLYGKTLSTSISKFEDFFANHYEYFLKYGLKLNERDVFELSAANTGEFFHTALDMLMKQLKADNVKIADLDKELFNRYMAGILDTISLEPQFQILHSSNRMEFLLKQLKQTVHQIGWGLRNKGKRTKMQTLGTEVLFGHVGADKGLKALSYPIDQIHKVNVRGKIDRIDQMIIDNQTYLGIVDYKSSRHNFDYQDAYYGLAMQMLTYLNALMENADLLLDEQSLVSEPKPAGAVYMHLKNPVLKKKDIINKDIDDAMLKEYKYQGLILNETELLDNLDLTLDGSAFSSIYPIRRKKDGSYSGDIITFDDLRLLMQHNKKLITDAAKLIYQGDVAMNPVMWPDKRTALQYSPYKAIMQFDELLGNRYHRISKHTNQEIMDLIAKEQKGGQIDGI